MSTTQAAQSRPGPIRIHRGVDSDGETFALDPRSMDLLRAELGPAFHGRSRLFLANEKQGDHKRVEAAIAPPVVLLLTGLSEEQLEPLGGVIFWDPVTEEELPRA